MYKHLQTFVLAQVKGCVFIYSLRLSSTEIAHRHRQSLLVLLNKLWLTWVLSTVYAWRKGVVYRYFIVVFFNANGAYCHRSRGRCSVGKVLCVLSPLTTYEVERTKTQYNRLLKVRQEHTHETYTGEVADVTHTLLELLQWDSELVPGHCFGPTFA